MSRFRPHAVSIINAAILSLWIVSSTHAENRIIAETIAAWDFGAAEDKRKDGWPDGWIRRIDRDHPKFIPIGIVQSALDAEQLQNLEATRRLVSQLYLAHEQGKYPWQVIPESTPSAVDHWLERSIANPYLRVQMDGGSAEIASPITPVDNNSVYYATAMISSDSTDFSVALRLRFLDSNKSLLFETTSKPIAKKSDWHSIATNTIYQAIDSSRYVQVVLTVEPKNSRSYKAVIGFDSIRIHRTPRLTLFVDKPNQMYRVGEKTTVRCAATGMNTDQPSLTLKLVDHTGTEILSADKLFIREENPSRKFVSKNSQPSQVVRSEYWDGYCEWVLPNLDSGYYEISTQLSRGTSSAIELLEHFVVLPNDNQGKFDNRFGWSICDFDGATPSTSGTARLLESLREAHVGKVKLPVWFDHTSPSSAKEFTDRVDRIQTTGIQCVGVLASPPSSIREKFPRMESNDTGIALEDSVMVHSFLEPVLRQMCVRIVEFQIGWDHETDFVPNPRFGKSLETIVRLVKRYGQDTQMIASHNIHLPMPKTKGIDLWHLYSPDELTDEETLQFLTPKSNDPKRPNPWFSITPIDAYKYSLDVRIQDLAARMLAAVKEPVVPSTGWISNPSDDRVGIIDRSGGPREMFLPFRAIVGALVGMRNIGSVPVASLGYNRLLIGGDQARIIAWSVQPTTAQLFLGENVQARDVWGRVVPISLVETPTGKQHRLDIGKWPIIIDNVDPRVAQWRMGLGIVDRRIDPLKGTTQEIQVRFVNQTSSPASGSVTLFAPTIISEPAKVLFEIEPNSQENIDIPFTLVPDASSTTSPVQLLFNVSGESPVKFSIDEQLQVGSDDVEFNLEYQFDKENQLWVTVEGINYREQPVSFDCILLVPNRPRERTQFANLKERTSQTFVFPKANDLIGETLWLRCEQFGTRRVLNQQKRVELTEENTRK